MKIYTTIPFAAIWLISGLTSNHAEAFDWDEKFMNVRWSTCSFEPKENYPNPGYLWRPTSSCGSNQCANIRSVNSAETYGCFSSQGTTTSLGRYFSYHPTSMEYNPGRCTIKVSIYTRYAQAHDSDFSMSASGASVKDHEFERNSITCSADLMNLGVSWGVVQAWQARLGRVSIVLGSMPNISRKVYVDGILVGDESGYIDNPIPVGAICTLSSPSVISLDHGILSPMDESVISKEWMFSCDKPGTIKVSFAGGGERVANGYKVSMGATPSAPTVNLCLFSSASPQICYGGSGREVMTLTGISGGWSITSTAQTDILTKGGVYEGTVILIGDYL